MPKRECHCNHDDPCAQVISERDELIGVLHDMGQRISALDDLVRNILRALDA